MTPPRPITILIAALGGEGGGVLTQWIVSAAAQAGFPVQSTSIPGVAQRTGATTYYVEVLPTKVANLDGRRPILALTPGVGDIDIAVASDRATFRVPELLRGIPDATYAAVLPAHVGIAVARDLLLTGRRFDAAEALRLGVISRVVPHEELRDAAVEAARQVLRTAPEARMHVKRMLNQRYGDIDYQTMFWALDHSDEPREGMRAFMERRPPIFTGRRGD